MAFVVINDGSNSGGGGGGTVNTANGISGDGSVSTPVILGGALNQTTDITLNGNIFTLDGNQSNLVVDDTFDTESARLEYRNAGGDAAGISVAHGVSVQQFFAKSDISTIQRVSLLDTRVTPKGMTVEDQLNSIGVQNFADYSADTTPTRLAQFNELSGGSGGLVASLKAAGLTSSQNLITYPIPAGSPSVYNIIVTANYRVGTGNASIALTWTDTGGNVNNEVLLNVVVVGGSSVKVSSIYAIDLTDIAIDFAVAGTVIVDVGVAVQYVI